MGTRNVLLLLFLLACTACATVPVLPPQTPESEEILSRISSRSEALRGMKALGQVHVSLGEKNFNVSEVFLAFRPAFLRMEALSPFGTPQLFLVADGPDLSVYNPGENRFYHGRASADHLSSMLPFIPVALAPEEVISFLLGGVPEQPGGKVSIGRDESESLWIVDRVSDSGLERQRLWVEPRSFLISRAEFHRPGLSARLSFSDFRESDGIPFPYHIQFSATDPDIRISIKYEDLEINPPLRSQDFKLPVPRGAEVIPLK